MTNPPPMRPRKLASLPILLVAVFAVPLPHVASSSAAAPPPSSLGTTGRWGFLPGAARRRLVARGGSFGGADGSAAVERAGVLDEWDFWGDDGDDDDCDDHWSDEESIARIRSTDSWIRGGAAAAASGKNGGLRKRLRQQKEEQLRKLEHLQQTKLRQFRQAFRQKQRQFQSSLYTLNSRTDPYFPKPPYSLWRPENDGPVIGKATLTGTIFLVNIAVFGLQTLYPQLTALGAKRSDMIMEGRQLYRLLTPIFLHGGIGHLMANSYSLKSMGTNVEKAFGRPRLLATYLASGVAGNVLSAIQSPNPAVGASGAIFGLVGAYYTFLSRNGDLFGNSASMQKSALIETIGFNLLLGMTNPMIDNWGHVGGFIGGVGMAYLIGPKLYVARVPLGDGAAGGFGAGKVIVDRPALTFRTPAFVDEGVYWANDNARKLGWRVKLSVRGLFNNKGGGQEYFLDRDVDLGSLASNAAGGIEDGTIYRTLKGDVPLEGDVNLTPADGLRQDVSQLDPARRRQSRRQPGKRAPAGRSLRPQYGHLYR